jgi:hypothetical protein
VPARPQFLSEASPVASRHREIASNERDHTRCRVAAIAGNAACGVTRKPGC